jgi:hypothetical protein
MARIKIKDLPKDVKISEEEMRKIQGGYLSIRTSINLSRSSVGTVVTNPYQPISDSKIIVSSW